LTNRNNTGCIVIDEHPINLGEMLETFERGRARSSNFFGLRSAISIAAKDCEGSPGISTGRCDRNTTTKTVNTNTIDSTSAIDQQILLSTSRWLLVRAVQLVVGASALDSLVYETSHSDSSKGVFEIATHSEIIISQIKCDSITSENLIRM